MPVKRRTTDRVVEPRGGTVLPPAAWVMAELFKHIPDIAFFVKDRLGRYVGCNDSLVERCGLRDQSELIGRQPHEVFPAELGKRYAAQDQQVLRTGRSIVERLELHWYPHQRTGWCLTTKLPVRDDSGKIVGLVGISRDLRAAANTGRIPAGMLRAIEFLEANYGDELSPAVLALKAGLSSVRFARLTKRIFRVTPSQWITQTRISAASRMLVETDQPVAVVAHACGFYDHSAFTRAFRSATGSTPTQFRERAGEQTTRDPLPQP